MKNSSQYLLWCGIPCRLLRREWKSDSYVFTVRFDNGEEYSEVAAAFDYTADDYINMEEM